MVLRYRGQAARAFAERPERAAEWMQTVVLDLAIVAGALVGHW
jgi:hypothetical protein